MSQRARKLFVVEDLERGGFGMPRREQQGRCWHDYRKLRNEVSPSFYAAIDPDTAAASGLRLSNGRVEEFRDSYAVEHFAHCHSTPALIGATHAQGKTCTGCGAGTSELCHARDESMSIRSSADTLPVPKLETLHDGVNRVATGARS